MLVENIVKQCYHDVLSDINITIVIKISPYDTIAPGSL